MTKRIGISAEFAALIKKKNNLRYAHFISKKTSAAHYLTRKIFGESRILDIFAWRLKLSKIFEDKIESSKARQIIELGAGYSLQGFEYSSKNPKSNYIEIDQKKVIENKQAILEKICRKEGISFPDNLRLVSCDVIKDNLYESIDGLVLRNKKTLMIAEGMSSYFTDDEFDRFLKNVKQTMTKFNDSEFFSHETPQREESVTFKTLRYFITIITGRKSNKRFKEEKELEEHLKNAGFSKYKAYLKERFLIYSIKK